MSKEVYTYNKRNVLSFAKTTGRFGGFSNMAPDFAMFVNEINVPNVEALYQACKFSLYPQIQKMILEEKNPMQCKMISRKYQSYVRQDWEMIKYAVMEWCVKVKLLQNWNTFGSLLKESGTSVIVEYSTKDNVWGAMPKGEDMLEGENALGRLLMKIRHEFVESGNKPVKITPPQITGMMLYGVPIGDVYTPEYYFDD